MSENLWLQFLITCHRTPNAVVCAEGHESLTYNELKDQALGVRHKIRSLVPNLAPNTRIGLLFDSGCRYISGLLGVLSAGCVYLPLDARASIQRNQMILDDAHCDFLLYEMSTNAKAQKMHSVELLMWEDSRIKEASIEADALSLPHGLAPALILYTSGSSGMPRGVVHSHRSMIHGAQRITKAFEVTSEDRYSWIYPLHVHGTARDVFSVLISGCSIHRFGLQHSNLLGLATWLNENRITVLCFVTTVGRFLGRILPKDFVLSTIRLIKIGGETVHVGDLQALSAHLLPNARISCGLASTECSTISQYYPDLSMLTKATEVSCGHPLSDIDVSIVDPDSGELLPEGSKGEIWVCSEFISLGYVQGAGIASHQQDSSGKQLFKTGDLGRLSKGELYFYGRKDLQVKVNGNRVDIIELEGHLQLHPQVKGAAVVAVMDQYQRTVLVAYIESLISDKNLELDDVRNWMNVRLATYMTPHRYQLISALPQLSNGKLDRKKLEGQAIAIVQAHEQGNESESQGQDHKELLRVSWKNLFDQDKIDDSSNFFSLGGDSITAALLVDQIANHLNQDKSIEWVARHPTFGQMSDSLISKLESPKVDLKNNQGESISLRLAKLREGTSKSIPIVLCAPAGGWVYPYIGLVNRMPEGNDWYGVQYLFETPSKANSSIDIGLMATKLLELVDATLGHREVIFAGWSFGGFLAYEVGNQRIEKGLSPEWPIVMFDSDLKVNKRKNRIFQWLRDVNRFFLLLSVLIKSARTAKKRIARSKSSTTGQQRKKNINWSIHGYKRFLMFNLSVKRYSVPRSEQKVIFVGCKKSIIDRILSGQEDDHGWSGIAPNMKVYTSSGNHITMLNEEHLEQPARALAEALEISNRVRSSSQNY